MAAAEGNDSVCPGDCPEHTGPIQSWSNEVRPSKLSLLPFFEIWKMRIERSGAKASMIVFVINGRLA